MKHLEHEIQKAIITRLKLAKMLCFAVPNGGSRNLKEAVKLKKEGVLKGVKALNHEYYVWRSVDDANRFVDHYKLINAE